MLRPQGFHHCLAGSTDALRTLGVSLSPFAGLCVPQPCGPWELADPALATGLSVLLAAATADLSLSAAARQQASGFLANLEEAAAAAAFLKVGFTCGDHRLAPVRESPAALATASGLVALALVGVGAALARRGQFSKEWAAASAEASTTVGGGALSSSSGGGGGGPRYGAVAHDDGNGGSRNGGSDGGSDGLWSWAVVCECFDPLRNLHLLMEVDDTRRGAFRALDGKPCFESAIQARTTWGPRAF